MLTKRRLTVQPVDEAGFGSGGDLVVSFRNGADHTRPTPVPSEDPPVPLDSCVMVHSYGGAQCVDGWLNARGEYIGAVGVSPDGVVACRVGELPVHNLFATSAASATKRHDSARGERMEKMVFLSGRHRLAEMLFSAVDEAALTDHGGAQARPERNARFPLLCLRAPHGHHVAVCARDRSSLTACVSHGDRRRGGCDGAAGSSQASSSSSFAAVPSQTTTQHLQGDGRQGGGARCSVLMRNREAQIQFNGRRIVCLGAGRPQPLAVGGGHRHTGDEATILLNDHTVAVYGFPTRGAAAPHQTDGFPVFEAILTCPLPLGGAPPTDAAPVRVAWAGRRTLWIAYEDGTLCAWQTCLTAAETSSATPRGSAGEQQTRKGENEEVGGGSSDGGDAEVGMSFRVAFVGRLVREGGGTTASPRRLDRLCLQADVRTSALHYCFSLHDGPEGAATLYYGTVCIPSHPHPSPAESSSATIQNELLARQRSLLCGECVHGIRYNGGRYHLLTQSRRGHGPLCLASLPRAPPPTVVANDASAAPVSLQIMYDPEERLGGHCRYVESGLRRINDRGGGAALRSEAEVMAALAQLQELKQCVYALLCREQQQQQLSDDTSYISGSGAGSAVGMGIRRSYPQRLLQQLNEKYMEVSVYLLLAQLGCLDAAIEQPLHESLGLQSCREQAWETQQALKAFITSTTFPVVVETDALHTQLWPMKATLCIDTILAHLGVSSTFSLAQVLVEGVATSHSGGLSPVLGLLVLYYSYRAFFPSSSTAASTGESALPTRAAQQRANEVRQSFLAQCNLPATCLNTWAFASYAVDHGIDPTARTGSATSEKGEGEGEEEAEAGQERAADRSTEAAFAYVLGAAVSHLDAPPLLALLPALVNGLLSVFAMDTVHRLMSTTLAIYGAGEELPPSLGLVLLFVALQARADREVESIFVRSRGTPLEAVAAQALALVALRTGDVAAIRGLVAMGSAQERRVEATLRGCTDVVRRERLLLRFYILMQRFADALAVCEAIASRDAVEGQRVSAVASHLRSLMPHGNTEYMRRGDGTAASHPREDLAALPPSPPALPCSPAADGGAGQVGWASVVPTPLEAAAGEMEEQLRRAVAPFGAAAGGGPRASGAAVLSALPGTASHSSASGGAAQMRPSAILSSLERSSAGPTGAGGKAQRQPFSGGPSGSGGTPSARGGDEEAPASTPPQWRSTAAPAVSALGAPRFHGVGDGASNTRCEAVLQRSGKVCGRARPCPYHDRR